MIDLTTYPPLKLLLEFETEEGIIDLHNDYECIQIKLFEAEIKFLFSLIKANKEYTPISKIPELTLNFKKLSLNKSLDFSNEKLPLTLDNLSRVKYKEAYIVSFIEGEEYEIEAEEANITW
jgi:hypothetical protein